jgi:hypothetical protein
MNELSGRKKALVTRENFDDPNNSLEKRVSIELTIEWKTYCISLAEFSPTNLKTIAPIRFSI